uniref:Uncharacterized protein n=1 Tax=Peronospora matthiolae TaxID=2874970 RepID=A0AAV1UM85_9STRA
MHKSKWRLSNLKTSVGVTGGRKVEVVVALGVVVVVVVVSFLLFFQHVPDTRVWPKGLELKDWHAAGDSHDVVSEHFFRGTTTDVGSRWKFRDRQKPAEKVDDKAELLLSTGFCWFRTVPFVLPIVAGIQQLVVNCGQHFFS